MEEMYLGQNERGTSEATFLEIEGATVRCPTSFLRSQTRTPAESATRGGGRKTTEIGTPKPGYPCHWRPGTFDCTRWPSA